MKDLSFKKASAHLAKKQHMPVERVEAGLAASARKLAAPKMKVSTKPAEVPGMRRHKGY